MGRGEIADILWTVCLTVFWFTLAFPFNTVVHELGHALAGWLLGMRVLACGIGLYSPVLSIRFLGTAFFIARPFYGGFTLAIDGSISPPRWKMILLTAGGPAASLLLSLYSFLLLADGYHPFLVGTMIMAGWTFLHAMIPGWFRSDGNPANYDGPLMLCFWRDEAHLLSWPGETLASEIALRDFFRQLNHVQGQVYYTLFTALARLELEDVEAARLTLLDPILQDTRRGRFGRKLEALVRAVVMTADSEQDASAALQEAEAALQGDAYGLATLELNAALWLKNRGEDARPRLSRAGEHAFTAGSPHLMNAVEAIRLILDSPPELAERLRALLSEQGAGQLSPSTALWLTTQATEIFVRRNEPDRALEFHCESLHRLREIASTIHDPELRDRYEGRYLGWLNAATAELGLPPVRTVCAKSIHDQTLSAPQKEPDGLSPLGKVFALVGALVLAMILVAALMSD